MICLISVQFSVFSQIDSLKIGANIPYGIISDFEFFHNGIFISSDADPGIKYYSIDTSYNLSLKYTISPPNTTNDFNQFVIRDSLQTCFP